MCCTIWRPVISPSRKTDEQRDTLLEVARDNYPDAISAKSTKPAGLLPTAGQLVRGKPLVRAKSRGEPAYRWPDPLPQQTVIATRPRGSGGAYEREVQDAMKKLRECGGMTKRKRPSRRRATNTSRRESIRNEHRLTVNFI
jgi:hypothetical protein